MDGGERGEILARLHDFLLVTAMEAPEAAIYVLALQKGVISSSDVTAHVPGVKNPTTAKDKLDKLASQGFLELSAGEAEGGTGKRGKPILFRPIPPSVALRKHLKSAVEVVRDMGRLDELLELGAEPSDENEVWLLKEEDAALGRLASAIDAASSEVQAYCRDGSWWGDKLIREAVERAAKRGVKVRVAGSQLSEEALGAMKAAGLDVIASSIPMSPFIVVDRTTLFLPHQTGRLSSRYGAIRLTNRYLVRNLSGFVDHHFAGGRAL
ncbi:MAG: hypothetical protein WDA16_14060 [Candidatus Thermoplasmatota archaeon]